MTRAEIAALSATLAVVNATLERNTRAFDQVETLLATVSASLADHERRLAALEGV